MFLCHNTSDSMDGSPSARHRLLTAPSYESGVLKQDSGPPGPPEVTQKLPSTADLLPASTPGQSASWSAALVESGFTAAQLTRSQILLSPPSRFTA